MDLGVRLFSSLFEDFLNYSYNKDPHAFDDAFKPVTDSFPDFVPTAIAPILEAVANYDSFRKTAIVPNYQQKFPASSQVAPNSSSFSKFVGDIADISPRIVDHIIFGYTGNFGKESLRFADALTGSRDYNAKLPNDFPLLGGFFRMPYQNPKVVSDFYRALDEQTAWHNDFKATKKKSPHYNEKLYLRLHNAQKQMTELSKKERALMFNTSLNGDLKQQRQLAIQKKRIAIAQRALK